MSDEEMSNATSSIDVSGDITSSKLIDSTIDSNKKAPIKPALPSLFASKPKNTSLSGFGSVLKTQQPVQQQMSSSVPSKPLLFNQVAQQQDQEMIQTERDKILDNTSLNLSSLSLGHCQDNPSFSVNESCIEPIVANQPKVPVPFEPRQKTFEEQNNTYFKPAILARINNPEQARANEEFKGPPQKRTSSQARREQESDANKLFSDNSSIFHGAANSISSEYRSEATKRETQDLTIEETKSRYETLIPYAYQDEIYKKILENWRKESDANGKRLGNIVFLETGTGKTYIAIMLLKAIFASPINGLNDAEVLENAREIEIGASLEPLRDTTHKYSERIDKLQNEYDTLELKQRYNQNRKIAVFIIPTQNLVEQQATIIDRYTKLTVGRYHGGQKNKKFYTDFEAWQSELALRDVLVMMAKKFYDLLLHGFIKMEQIELLVIDECHHTDQEHLYNMIMRDFFFHKFEPLNPDCKRPRVLGLTASPIKQKIESKCVLPDDIEKMLQNLANNLYSRYVTVSIEVIKELEKQLDMQIQQYRSNFDENVRTVQWIEEILLKDLVTSLKLPADLIKTDLDRYKSPIKQVMDLLNESVRWQSEEEQDTQVLNFLNGRKQLIELDCSWSKKEIDISQFPLYEDQLLLLLCIIILKNVNNLLIEIGPLAVKAFILDLKHDLLEVNTDKIRFGDKKQLFVNAIEKFCSHQMDEQGDSLLSDKVISLIQILQESYERLEKQNGGNDLKTIVFVKDRSVAVYLKKILSGDIRESDKILFEHKGGYLDKTKFRIGFAMGPKNKNLVNKAYKSTKSNVGRGIEYKALSQQFPSCRTIKLTKTQLDQTLDDFRKGYINILIATNVVEEGLDVSTCNQVICLNELLTVKAFIQMKGRARQQKSKFIFLCAKEQYTQVKEDQESFKRVIQFMKQITGREKKELQPEANIIQEKQLIDDDFIYIPSTGAKLTARDAKLFVDQFCLMIAPATNDLNAKMDPNQTLKSTDNFRSGNNMGVNPQDLSGASDIQMQDTEVKYLDFRPNYVIKESTHQNSLKYFLCVLYMPLTCKDKGITKVNPKNAYAKKKDAENHVALLAVRKLKEKGYFDDYLFPVLSHPNFQGCLGAQVLLKLPAIIPTKPNLPPLSQEINVSQNASNPQSHIPRKQKHTTDEQRIQTHQDNKQFQNLHKGRLEFEQLQNQVNLQEFKCKVDDLYVHTFFADPEDAYPYKNSRDFLGILFDRQFDNPCFEFLMYQENKQQQKNSVHLDNLLQLNLISKEIHQAIQQPTDALKVSLKREKVFALGTDIQRYVASKPLQAKDYRSVPMTDMCHAKLSFFHYWIFFYLYSADHKFLEAIFKHQFAFVNYLFSNDIKQINKFANLNDQIPAEKHDKSKKINQITGLPCIPNKCYTVPIVKMKNGALGINWPLIDRVLDNIRHRLYEVKILTSERNIVVHKYDLEEIVRKEHLPKPFNDPITNCFCDQFPCMHDFNTLKRQRRAQMVKYLWDQNFQGNRYVILHEEGDRDYHGRHVLKTPLDYNQNKQDDDQFKHNFVEWYRQFKGIYSRKYFGMSSHSREFIPQLAQMFMSRSLDESQFDLNISNKQTTLMQKCQRTTKQEYYFLKQGLFQSSMFNKYVVKCRKERHFFDFGKKNKEEEDPNKSVSYSQYVKTRGQPKHNQSMNYTMNHSMSRSRITDQSSILSNRKVNTEFDMIDSMLTLSPVSYNQYQVLLQTCFHLQNFNEFLVIEKFIKEKFEKDQHGNDMYCLLDLEEKNPADVSNDLFRTIEQIAKQRQEYLAAQRNTDVTMLDISVPYNRARVEALGAQPTLELRDHDNAVLEQKEPVNEISNADFAFKVCRASEQLQKRMHLIREALTSPSACRDYDYERLEFYGDSIAGFLVILELFLTLPDHVEGDLDHERINRVQNTSFFKVNKAQQFYHYMITDPHHVYSGFVPTGFDNRLRFQDEIIHKSYNEQYNRLRELQAIKKRLDLILHKKGDKKNLREPLNFMFLRGDIYTLLSMLVRDFEENGKYSLAQKIIYDDELSLTPGLSHHERVLELYQRLIEYDKDSCPWNWLHTNIELVIKRFEIQLEKKMQDRESKNRKTQQMQRMKNRQLYLKQLADVVESITGAVMIACGLNFTQNFLHKIGVLSCTQDELRQHMDYLTEQQNRMNKTLEPHFFQHFRLRKVEEILRYDFKCKSWLIEALTHKSWIDQSVENSLNLGPNLRIQDYERLEFLGDSILSYLVAKYFFLSTQEDEKRKMPKELHKMKTSIIQNCCLSLIVIEQGIHNHIIYNEKAAAFKEQFDKCVEIVMDLNRQFGTTRQLCEQMEKRARQERMEEAKDQVMQEDTSTFQEFESVKRDFGDQSFHSVLEMVNFLEPNQECRAFDLDKLHEHNLKIFGDVFESLIGAVFMDSQSIDVTWRVLEQLIMPYIKVYANLDTLQDHPRTKLLELWNQKSYTKIFKCNHTSETDKTGEQIVFRGEIRYSQQRLNREVIREVFQKEAKNKIRSFYKKFYELVKRFVDFVDKKGEDYERQLENNPERVVQMLQQINADILQEERRNNDVVMEERK